MKIDLLNLSELIRDKLKIIYVIKAFLFFSFLIVLFSKQSDTRKKKDLMVCVIVK